jgi:hypothetical protein
LFAVRCYEVGWVGGWKIPLPKHTQAWLTICTSYVRTP